MVKKYLAVIPARGGSKRLPGKNLMSIGGHSLIGCAIECAKSAEHITEICVTTDDQDIANEALKYGPYVHFMRPDFLASDEARTIDVVLHAVQWFSNQGKDFDAVVVLQPTSPLRSQENILKAIQLFEQKDAQAVVSVCRLEHPMEWCAELGIDGNMEEFGKTCGALNRSQDTAVTYRLNGAIYIYDLSKLIEVGGFFYNKKTFAYEMNAKESIDIDTYEDFLLARFWDEVIENGIR
ncbi:acylneuraminate cytidylyltransferase family protein [Desulfuromonas acetoxidans]|uniref:Acylneuraminate cytidylyltransferase n=1 Tax=Desulfuromonas acetoxidans (strain DSM 684 / 11070) TaxID=281689 RepID=Q1K173_DESA6|nr:acylneuraminate cytidylyltransferase family protein [Desulfuromonas acetoxidans]EAT16135.1 acylneuraminate cytidylyltransferase [Desulfuromonas acetoxidans DSM 684]MBF0646441.1 acylneuraminate cytidylyltransferase family protein [Desulfuromonas acetoxidans]NVD25512.1 acylneuraminate cytidylyltransferase family protein [Desulfuromonas acetoxidans]NVE17538.1 acylneuraminate cytidylyltransferase family protein [Desulfuromonas acetoxidans]